MTAFRLTDDFLDAAKRTEGDFDRILATLKAQTAAVNSNPHGDDWNGYFLPITSVLLSFQEEKNHQRSAELIEALYIHCGVPLHHSNRPFARNLSDVALAMMYNNFPALVVLLEKCGAVFLRSDRPMEVLCRVTTSFTKTLPFLRTLLRLRDTTPQEVLDPNVLYCGTTALHEAASCYYGGKNDPDPRVVRLLISGFGADPLFLDEKGRTPLEILTRSTAYMARHDFKTDAEYLEWKDRVTSIASMLQPRDRDVAVLMGASQPRLGAVSLLRRLHSDSVRSIIKYANELDAGDLSPR